MSSVLFAMLLHDYLWVPIGVSAFLFGYFLSRTEHYEERLFARYDNDLLDLIRFLSHNTINSVFALLALVTANFMDSIVALSVGYAAFIYMIVVMFALSLKYRQKQKG